MANIKEILQDITPPFAWRWSKKLIHNSRSSLNIEMPDGDLLLEQKCLSIKGIFVHIHKCAGSSLIQGFIDNPYIVSCIARPGVFPGRTGRERIPKNIFNDSLKFTFVRNPFARLVSAYLMFSATLTWKNVYPSFNHFVNFIRWTDVDNHEVKEEVKTNDFRIRPENLIHHCSSFHNPKYMIEQMDYIGRVERLNEDLAKISEMLNFDYKPAQQLNMNKKEYNYRDYYTPATQKIVAKLYERDIDRFKYCF